jgi:hypothetical protein
VAPDRTALASGLSGLALAAISAVPWATVANRLAGHPGAAHPSWAIFVIAPVRLAGFGLGVLAIWSTVKASLEGALSLAARWGIALGLATMLFVVALGPCDAKGCGG